MRFAAFLALGTAVVGAFVIYAFTWAERPEDPRVELAPHVTRLAFGLEEWPVVDDTDCGMPELVLEPVPPGPPRSIHVVDLTFVGEGDWDIGATLLRRRARELHVCYAEDAEDQLELRLRDWAEPEVVAADTVRAACIEEQLGDWPWPQDLQGRVRLHLRAGHLL